MTANTRLQLICFTIFLSAIYAVIVAQDSVYAPVFASGYIAILLTIFAIVNVWKKP